MYVCMLYNKDIFKSVYILIVTGYFSNDFKDIHI